MKFTITGYSDDNVSIEPDDDYDAYGGARFARFSDGTVLKIEYAPEGYGGNWKIEVAKQGTAKVEIKKVDLSDPDPDPYSDVATIEGDGLRLVGFGETIEPTKSEYVGLLTDFEPDRFSLDQLARIHAITREGK